MVSKDTTHNFRIKIQIYKIPKYRFEMANLSITHWGKKKKQKTLLNILKYTLI